jgi:hypothetical protein
MNILEIDQIAICAAARIGENDSGRRLVQLSAYEAASQKMAGSAGARREPAL